MPQQFVVPQFIDVESKIFGPITMRQFVIILAAFFLEFIVYKLSDMTLFIALSAFIFPVSGLIAFGRVNGLPIHLFLLDFVQAFKNPKIRVWDKSLSDSEIAQFMNRSSKTVVETKLARKSPLQGSRLAELSLIIDTGGVYQGENVLQAKSKKRKM